MRQAREMLEMPPVLPLRRKSGKEIERDERLSGYLETKMVVTDTSEHKEDYVRVVEGMG